MLVETRERYIREWFEVDLVGYHRTKICIWDYRGTSFARNALRLEGIERLTQGRLIGGGGLCLVRKSGHQVTALTSTRSMSK